MIRGDIVISRDGPFSTKTPLVSGAERYTHAICVSVEPFVLVSEQGDMLWSMLDRNNYIGLAQGHQSVCKKAFDRYDRHQREEKHHREVPNLHLCGYGCTHELGHVGDHSNKDWPREYKG